MMTLALTGSSNGSRESERNQPQVVGTYCWYNRLLAQTHNGSLRIFELLPAPSFPGVREGGPQFYFQLQKEKNFKSEVQVKLLGMTKSSLVGLVGCTKDDRDPKWRETNANILNICAGKLVSEITIFSEIKRLLLTRKFVILMTVDGLWIYDYSNSFQNYFPIPENSAGVVTMSQKEPFPTLAVPSRNRGQVVLVSLETAAVVGRFEAHRSGLTKMAFQYQGELMATCSPQGTLIRIWNTKGCVTKQVAEFRRGYKPQTIVSIGFSTTAPSHVVCVSLCGTVHVFSLGLDSDGKNSCRAEIDDNDDLVVIEVERDSIQEEDAQGAHLNLPKLGAALMGCPPGILDTATRVDGPDEDNVLRLSVVVQYANVWYLEFTTKDGKLRECTGNPQSLLPDSFLPE